MTLAAVLAATLLAQTPVAPDLAIHPGELRGPPEPPALERGPFTGGELAASGAGVLLGDAAVIGLGYGTFRLFTSGTVSATASHFRHAALGLGAATLLLPPLAAVLGGSLARIGPARGAPWKAFLLALLGHALALGVGYRFAPNYWAILPVQLATMTVGTSFGLHWGRVPSAQVRRVRGDEPAGQSTPSDGLAAQRGTAVATYLPRLCVDTR